MFEINSCCYPGLETKVFSRDWYTAWPLVVNHIRLIPFIKTRQLLPSFNQVQTRHHQTGNLSKHLSCIERDRAPRNLKEISNQAQALFASRKWTWQFQKKKNFSFLVDNKFITHVKPEQSRKRKPIDGPWTLFNSSPSWWMIQSTETIAYIGYK